MSSTWQVDSLPLIHLGSPKVIVTKGERGEGQIRGLELMLQTTIYKMDFPGGSDGKASVYNAGDPGSIPGLGRSPGEGNGSPLQYYCLENSMDRGAW